MVNRVVTVDEFTTIAEDLLRSGRNIAFTARGASMQPFIRDGDTVIVQPVEMHQVRVADTVFFRWPADRQVIHRVICTAVAEPEPRICARGDAVMRLRETFSPDQLLGRVAGIERAGKKISFESTGHRLTARVWLWAYPLRYLLRATRRRLRRHTGAAPHARDG